MRRLFLLAVVGLLVAAASEASGGTIYEIDYATYDVRISDTRGVATDATEFGFNTGPNILYARRGDAYVEIPFRKIRSITVSDYIPSKGYSPCTVVARNGDTLQVEIERYEGERFLTGTTGIGSYRIRLGQIRRLDIKRLSRTDGFGD